MKPARLGSAVRHPSLWRQPQTWWVLQALAVLLTLALGPGLRSVRHIDTLGYLAALDGEGLRQDLSSHRTWGYPLFLKLASALPGGLDWIGVPQSIFFLVAVVSLGTIAGRYLGSPWQGLAFASPLFYCPLVANFAAALRPELPAATWAVLTLAGLLLTTLHPRRWWAWAALAISLALTYHTRPSYLFLLAWVPLAGLVLKAAREPFRGRRDALRWALGLGVASLLPYLLWCSLRLAAVGQFGLVSFGSINWIGITGSLLTPEMLPELPKADRPLARRLLERKAELGLSPSYDFDRLKLEYNKVVFDCALYAIRLDPKRPQLSPREQWVYANQRFTALSWAIVKARPGRYLRWLADASLSTLGGLAQRPWTLFPALACLVGLAVSRHRKRGALDSKVIALAATSLASAAMALALVLAVETPLERYILAAVLFVPGALLAVAIEAGLRREPQ